MLRQIQPSRTAQWLVHESCNPYIETGASTEYSLDGGNTWMAYKEQVVLNEEGIHRFLYRSTADADQSGSLEIKLDLTEPELHFHGESSYTIDQQVSITCARRM